MSDLTRLELWDLIDDLDAIPWSREMEVEQLMQLSGLDRDEAELVVDARARRDGRIEDAA